MWGVVLVLIVPWTRKHQTAGSRPGGLRRGDAAHQMLNEQQSTLKAE